MLAKGKAPKVPAAPARMESAADNPEGSEGESPLSPNLTRQKRHFDFQTGDPVKAIVTKGQKAGTCLGRVAIRSVAASISRPETGWCQASITVSARSFSGRTAMDIR